MTALRRIMFPSLMAAAELLLPLLLPAPSAAQEMAFPTLPVDAPAGVGATAACSHPQLQGTARCGVFRVYEDRESRVGRTLDIAFVVLESPEPGPEPGEPGAPILFLPGGPGESLTDGAVPISRGMPAAMRRGRDILLVDVRGVGRSGALSCEPDYPGGLESRFGTLFPLDFVAACRDALSRRARLDRYTTASSVDDIEELRRWLGYSELNLVGNSYGTRVAQVYMRRHPDAVRTAVLNGVAPVAEPLYVRHAFLLQRALDRLLEECRADAACAGAYPTLDEDLATLFARFEDGPVPVEVDGRTVPFSMGDLAYVLRGLLYEEGAALPMILHDGATGDLTSFARYYLGRTAWLPDIGGYHFSVLCAEDIALLTDDDMARETRGTFMGDHLIGAYRAACDLWPHAQLPPSHWEPVTSDVPTLLLSGARDPVTPPEGARAVARHLENSVHVVVPNAGHGVGGPCIMEMMRILITTGSVDGIDTSCVEAAPATPFEVPDAPAESPDDARARSALVGVCFPCGYM